MNIEKYLPGNLLNPLWLLMYCPNAYHKIFAEENGDIVLHNGNKMSLEDYKAMAKGIIDKEPVNINIAKYKEAIAHTAKHNPNPVTITCQHHKVKQIAPIVKHVSKHSSRRLPKRSVIVPEWPAIRSKILLRDKKCISCDTDKDLCVHHIDKNIHNNEGYNLVCMCNTCHMSLHSGKLKIDISKIKIR